MSGLQRLWLFSLVLWSVVSQDGGELTRTPLTFINQCEATVSLQYVDESTVPPTYFPIAPELHHGNRLSLDAGGRVLFSLTEVFTRRRLSVRHRHASTDEVVTLRRNESDPAGALALHTATPATAGRDRAEQLIAECGGNVGCLVAGFGTSLGEAEEARAREARYRRSLGTRLRDKLCDASDHTGGGGSFSAPPPLYTQRWGGGDGKHIEVEVSQRKWS